MAVFMSSVDTVLQAHRRAPETATPETAKPAAAHRAGSTGADSPGLQCQINTINTSSWASCMLRTRLKWRFTAAAFLRLRSAVGFS